MKVKQISGYKVLHNRPAEEDHGEQERHEDRVQCVQVEFEADPVGELMMMLSVAMVTIVTAGSDGVDGQDAYETRNDDADEASNDDIGSVAVESVLVAPQIQTDHVEERQKKAG